MKGLNESLDMSPVFSDTMMWIWGIKIKYQEKSQHCIAVEAVPAILHAFIAYLQ